MGEFSSNLVGRLRKRRSRRPKAPPSLQELQQQVQLLEAEQQEFGAPGIEQEKPGVFRTVIDLLSRPNYAIAGFAEEILGGERSVTRGLTRAMAEIFSGVGGIQGEKRAFGEVFENLGAGTTTLADVFPALEDTWVGNFGSRGAAGLAADILLDPLTYMSFGTRAAGRITGKVGDDLVQRVLNAEGMAVRQRIAADVSRGLGKDVVTAERRFAKRLFGETDEFSRRRARGRLFEEVDRRTFAELSDASGDIAKQYLDPGGIKLFGKSAISNDALRGLYGPMRAALKAVPGGPRIAESAATFRDGLKSSVTQLFGAHGELHHLPDGQKQVAIRLRRDFHNAAAAHRGRLVQIARPLAREYQKLAKSDPGIGKRWYDIREGVRANDLVGRERELYDETMTMYDSMRDTLLAHGVLTEDQIRKGYIFHAYENLQDLQKYHWNDDSPFSGVLSEQFTKARAWDRFEDSVIESRKLRAADEAAGRSRQYPILRPEYDVFKNLSRYIDTHSEALARQAWREEIVSKFGKLDREFDINALYDLHKPFVAKGTELYSRIERMFANAPTFSTARDIAGRSLQVTHAARVDIQDALQALDNHAALTVTQKNQIRQLNEVAKRTGALQGTDLLKARELVMKNRQLATDLITAREPSRKFLPDVLRDAPKRAEADDAFIRKIRKEMRRVNPDGQREIIRQLLTRVESSSQLVKIESSLWDEFGEVIRSSGMRAIRDGEIDRPLAKTLGERAAEMIPVKTKWTGDQGVHMPRAVWDDLNAVNSRLLNTSDFKEFRKMVGNYDYANNLFKLGNYTIWPASAVRDGYSNIALSMLDIGLQALNPKFHYDVIRMMAGRNDSVTLGGIRYTYDQLRLMAKDFGVWVPGEVFAEFTGASAKTIGAGTVARKALNMRGSIENEARMLLWYANMRRGVDPRRAADHVAEFLFNYGEVSQVEREFFRRLIPFYTFTRKNVELQAKMLRKNPGLVLNQTKPFRGRDSENESMVQWEAEALKIRMDRDGKTVHMLTGIDLPIRNIDTLWRGDFGRTGRSIVGMVTPMLKTIPELLLNQDFFLGRDMTRTHSGAVGKFMDTVPTPQALKDWMGYRKTVDEAGRPSYTFDGRRFTLVFRSWMFSRAISTSDRQFRDNINGGGVQWQRIMLDTLTGIRRKDIDLDEQMRRRMNNRIRQLEESLARRGRRATFRKRFTPKDLGEFQ